MRGAYVTILFVAHALSAQSFETKQHISRIEEGLLPPVHVVNRPQMRMSLREEMDAHHMAAVSVAVIHDGQLEWAKAYGVVAKGGAPATPDTLFQAASISKSLTAMAALHLVQTHAFSLDTPVDATLKTWKLASGKSTPENPVTLRRLLSHTAGTNVHGFAGYAAGTPVPTLVQVLDGVKPAHSPAIVVDQVPGQAFRYSGGGFEIVQQMMLDASLRSSFPELMKQTVLRPIGMLHSTFEQPLPPSLLAQAAQPVDENGVAIPGGPHIYPEMAAAGLWTTPADMAKWLIEMQQSLLGRANHVLSTEMTKTMLTPVKDGYALGVESSPPDKELHFSQGGANSGFRSQYLADGKGNGAVVMTSSDSGDVLIGDLLRGVAAEYGWNAFHQIDRTAADIPLDEQLRYMGKFQSKDGFRFKVDTDNAQLVIHFNDGSSGPFVPSDSHSFFSVVSTLQVSFTSPDHGEVFWAPNDKEEFSRVP